jgi:hypothetical protein
MLERSEREAWQVLEFGMSNVHGYIEGCGKGGEAVGTFITTDPFPQNVARVVHLLDESIQRKAGSGAGESENETYRTLRQKLGGVLRQLSALESGTESARVAVN